MQEDRQGGRGGPDREEQRRAVERLAATREARELSQLLRQAGDVRQAAQAAARGDASALLAMVERLSGTREGAELMERLRRQAEESGLS